VPTCPAFSDTRASARPPCGPSRAARGRDDHLQLEGRYAQRLGGVPAGVAAPQRRPASDGLSLRGSRKQRPLLRPEQRTCGVEAASPGVLTSAAFRKRWVVRPLSPSRGRHSAPKRRLPHALANVVLGGLGPRIEKSRHIDPQGCEPRPLRRLDLGSRRQRPRSRTRPRAARPDRRGPYRAPAAPSLAAASDGRERPRAPTNRRGTSPLRLSANTSPSVDRCASVRVSNKMTRPPLTKLRDARPDRLRAAL
jgi:hypothetical protein